MSPKPSGPGQDYAEAALNLPLPALDRQGRSARKLRISVTDRCNFRCRYCMPDEPRWLPGRELLSFEQIHRLATLFVSRLGIEQIRLTGGEPLVRRELPALLRMLSPLRAQGLQRLSLTSNGSLLADQARALRAAGLDDVNVSLDALEPEAFARLSRVAVPVSQVLAGIDAARQAGLRLKINCVLIRGHNDDQVLPLLRWRASRIWSCGSLSSCPLRAVSSGARSGW